MPSFGETAKVAKYSKKRNGDGRKMRQGSSKAAK